MRPEKKLQIANILMVVGIVPLIVGIGRMFAGTGYDLQRPAQVGEFLMLLGGLVIFALVVSGIGAVWSALVAKRNPGIQGRASRALWIVVVLVLLLPLVIGMF